MRYFEKISIYKDRDDIILPIRSTKGSAGYDFFALSDTILESKKITLIKTGIKAYMDDDEYLMLSIRSSLAMKKNLMLANGQGIVDSSYYSNPSNDGEIGFLLINMNDDISIKISKGDRIGQGIFMKYLITKDDNTTTNRIGGFGSTGI